MPLQPIGFNVDVADHERYKALKDEMPGTSHHKLWLAGLRQENTMKAFKKVVHDNCQCDEGDKCKWHEVFDEVFHEIYGSYPALDETP